MRRILEELQQRFPDLLFRQAETFYWAPATGEVFYADTDNVHAGWSLLHETGHAVLNHQHYLLDIELLQVEVTAWHKAEELAEQLGLYIDREHIQDCLDTYRDWLYARSICPTCACKGLQQSDARYYHCFNCSAVWQVSSSRFCRPYRLGVPPADHVSKMPLHKLSFSHKQP